MRRISAILIGVTALFCSFQHASAVTIYGTAYTVGGPATLYTIDPATGLATPVGATGFSQISAIDFNPITGTLYGIGYDPNDGNRHLLSIDAMTGAATAIGSLIEFPSVQDISFRSDGTLFGFANGSLYTFDLTLGTASLVGATGLSTGSFTGNATAFDPSNVLYNINGNTISTLNQTNGAATDTNVDVMYPIELGTNPRANAMDYDLTTGILYASVVHGQSPTISNFIAEIDLATGNVTGARATVLGLDALAVLPEIQQPTNGVPEGMSTLWLAFPLIGLFVLARRRLAVVST